MEYHIKYTQVKRKRLYYSLYFLTSCLGIIFSNCCEQYYKTFYCPPDSQPSNIYLKIEEAFPIYLKIYEESYYSIKTKLDSVINISTFFKVERIVELRDKLDRNRSALQMLLKTSLLALFNRPCDSIAKSHFDDTMYAILELTRNMKEMGLHLFKNPESPPIDAALKQLEHDYSVNLLSYFAEINNKDKIDLPFEYAEPYKNNNAIIKYRNSYMVINQFGEIVIRKSCDSIINLDRGYFSFSNNNKWGLLKGTLKSTIKLLRVPLDQNRSSLQMVLQTAVVGYSMSPCEGNNSTRFNNLLSKISSAAILQSNIATSYDKVVSSNDTTNLFKSTTEYLNKINNIHFDEK